MLNNIPDEMKQYPHWVCWRLKDEGEGMKPSKEPVNPHTGENASVTNPATWGTFDECVNCIGYGGIVGIGFVLCQDNPYMIIDLDNAYETMPDGSYKHDDPEGVQALQNRIYAGFDTYSEISPSGTGCHIIVRGVALPNGRRRMAVEMYSDARFMTMTGNVCGGRNTINSSDELNARAETLWNQVGGGPVRQGYDGHAPQKYDDQTIITQMYNAKNGDTVVQLVDQHWSACGRWPSQSEADMALVNIIAFYTQNREQITRIFKSSPLGQRDKQTNIRGKSYINYMIDKSFDRLLPPIDLDGLRNQMEEAIARFNKKDVPMPQAQPQQPEIQIHNVPENYRVTAVPDDGEAGEFEAPKDLISTTGGVFSKPPGLVGDIAEFIYSAAPRPVPEIALCAALGLMAGICGRSYNVSKTGLNHYLLLLAKTGTGKEAMASGMEKIMLPVHKRVLGAYDFVGPGEVASSQALVKYMSKGNNTFISVVGEFGIYLKEMTAVNAQPHKVALRRLMLDLFNKSGTNDVVRPSIFSDGEKNTALIHAPNYSLLGESTPERFYESLDEGMITEGLLPRFTVVEYTGKRPHLNKGAASCKPSEDLLNKVSDLCGHSIMLNGNNEAIDVQMCSVSEQMFDDLNLECDNRINGEGARELTINLWNRAHIKSLKLAALLAVGVNYLRPTITPELAQWAINVVRADCANMLHRFSSGDVGANSEEVVQTNDATRVIREYLTRPWSEVQNYCASPTMHGERIIPFSYMSRRLQSVSSFRKDRAGATNSIKRVIQTFIDRGDLSELGKQLAHQRFNTSARCFAVTVPRMFGL